MTTLAELNKVVRDTIEAALSIPEVITANPNAPRPSTSFTTVYVAEMVQVGMKDIEITDNDPDVTEKIVRMFEARVSINFFRDNARLNAALYVSSMPANFIVDIMNSQGVGFTRASAVRELTQVFNSTHEERAQVDIFLHFELTPPTSTVTGIDSILITGDIDNGNDVLEQVQINVI